VIRSWAAVNSIVIAVQTLTYFSVLKRLNQRAVIVLQQEIETRKISGGSGLRPGPDRNGE
jgi:hypothetical protein